MRALTSHEIRKVAEGLTEDHVSVFRDAFLQLLLQIPTAMLILTEARNLPRQVFETSASEAIN